VGPVAWPNGEPVGLRVALAASLGAEPAARAGARRAGWESLTPTQAKLAYLVSQVSV
jgi:hypothetical protein